VRNLRHELVHELAHALVAAEGDRDDLTLNHAQEELVVESVTYTVAGALGIAWHSSTTCATPSAAATASSRRSGTSSPSTTRATLTRSSGPTTTVPWPSYTEHLDYELELGVVIGRSGTDIASESARDHIFGLTILNDFSARDIQNREMSVGLGPAKGKDFSTATGPWIATLDELPEPYDLKMTAQVDGEVWSEGNTSAMHWRLEEIIAHLSRGEPVRAGELFGTGTVGFGCGLELGRQLRPGNVVELEITGLGRLRNTIGEPPAKEERVASALPAVG
jgi:2-keto-4-pentenoate hydratase/2-oxohepta-3-ene-1,7-dioic acid hydratase in catechol pathway